MGQSLGDEASSVASNGEEKESAKPEETVVFVVDTTDYPNLGKVALHVHKSPFNRSALAGTPGLHVVLVSCQTLDHERSAPFSCLQVTLPGKEGFGRTCGCWTRNGSQRVDYTARTFQPCFLGSCTFGASCSMAISSQLYYQRSIGSAYESWTSKAERSILVKSVTLNLVPMEIRGSLRSRDNI